MRAKTKNNYLYKTAEQVEIAFYTAFGKGDFLLMESLLGDEGISCTTPGNVTIIGRDNVVTNWKNILDGIPKVTIDRKVLNVTRSQGVEVHLVLESFVVDELTGELSEVFSTNVYILQENGWRLQSQHSSLLKEKSFHSDYLLSKHEKVMSAQSSQALN